MDNLGDELRRFEKNNPDLMHIIDVYREIENAYNEALVAMGVVTEPVLEDGNTSDPSISFHLLSSSTSGD